MRRSALLLLVAIAMFVALAAGPVMAESQIDQSQTVNDYHVVWDVPFTEQSFTAQKTGRLDKVSIYLGCCYTPGIPSETPNPNPILVELEGTQAYIDDWYTGTDSCWSCGMRWVDVPLDPAPFVEAGKQYRFQLSTEVVSNNMYRLGFANSDVYPGGAWQYSLDGLQWYTDGRNWDMAFQTYVTPDTTAPKVDAVNPTDGTEGVARNTNLTATFSERMAPDTLSTSTFKLFKVNTNGTTSRITHAPVKLSADTLTAKLNPFGSSDTRLAKNTRYKVVVTTGATDVAGNALDQDEATSGNQQKMWYFTTGAR